VPDYKRYNNPETVKRPDTKDAPKVEVTKVDGAFTLPLAKQELHDEVRAENEKYR
jgi:hypothetical protein